MTTDGAQGRPVADTATGQPQRRRKPSAGWVLGPALGAFFAVLALLAFQVRAGNDPALGAPVAQVQKPRQIVVRRVITRVVIHHPAAATALPPSSPAAVQTSAPAPAPAPAPLTTQSS